MDATPSCVTVDLTRTKDFPDFGKDPVSGFFFDALEKFPEHDTPSHWEEGPGQGLQIFQVGQLFFYFSLTSISTNVYVLV